ncbi:hypothetical protein [Okeania sp. KiyG1]|nr:hypothetical protein [Okeania sp. KiyG1]
MAFAHTRFIGKAIVIVFVVVLGLVWEKGAIAYFIFLWNDWYP